MFSTLHLFVTSTFQKMTIFKWKAKLKSVSTKKVHLKNQNIWFTDPAKFLYKLLRTLQKKFQKWTLFQCSQELYLSVIHLFLHFELLLYFQLFSSHCIHQQIHFIFLQYPPSHPLNKIQKDNCCEIFGRFYWTWIAFLVWLWTFDLLIHCGNINVAL